MSAKTLLIRNARIWQSGQPDRSWMLLDTVTGRVLNVGQGQPPAAANTETTDVIDMKEARSVLARWHHVLCCSVHCVFVVCLVTVVRWLAFLLPDVTSLVARKTFNWNSIAGSFPASMTRTSTSVWRVAASTRLTSETVDPSLSFKRASRRLLKPILTSRG